MTPDDAIELRIEALDEENRVQKMINLLDVTIYKYIVSNIY